MEPRKPDDEALDAAQRRQVMRRKCNVCEWEADVVEPSDLTEFDCPWCHAPTIRVERADKAADHAAHATKNPHAAALGRLGGLKGGQARAAALTAKRRREIATKAARARWAKKSSG